MLKLNLGCGYRKLEGYVNLDDRSIVEPDLLCDISNVLPYRDNEIDEVRAFDFLEHIPIGKTVKVIEDIYRVLKPGGLFEHFTPSTDGRGAFQDPTHISFWNINSWFYYMDDNYRNLCGINAKFEGELKDILTDRHNNIVHTYGKLRAVK